MMAEHPPGQRRQPASSASHTSDPNDAWRRIAPPPELQRCAAVATQAVATCPVCEHAHYRQLTVGFDYELRTCANPWRFVRCARCGHVWLNPRPAVEALPTIYPPNYYAYNYDQQINRLAQWGKQQLDRLKLRSILRALGRAPSSFLDIGCGQGRYLRAMAEWGVSRQQIYGLELDEAIVRRLCAEGYRAFCCRVETCESIAPGQIDLATMFHVIEHVDSPRTVVHRVARWLAPGGVFAVETPNIDSLDARLFADRWWGGYHIPRHWNLFTPETLARLLQDAGFEIVTTRYQTGHSFWMYSLHHRLRYAGRPHPRAARWFDPFQSLLPLVGFTAFDLLRGRLGFRTSAMLMLARKPG